MAGLVPAIHALLSGQGADARDKAGHDVDRPEQNKRKRSSKKQNRRPGGRRCWNGSAL